MTNGQKMLDVEDNDFPEPDSRPSDVPVLIGNIAVIFASFIGLVMAGSPPGIPEGVWNGKFTLLTSLFCVGVAGISLAVTYALHRRTEDAPRLVSIRRQLTTSYINALNESTLNPNHQTYPLPPTRQSPLTAVVRTTGENRYAS